MKEYIFWLVDNFGEDFITIQASNIIKACKMFEWLYPEVCREDIKKIEDVSKQDFLDDEEKMIDFIDLSKEEFLYSYSYLTEEEYENTKEKLKKIWKENFKNLLTN